MDNLGIAFAAAVGIALAVSLYWFVYRTVTAVFGLHYMFTRSKDHKPWK